MLAVFSMELNNNVDLFIFLYLFSYNINIIIYLKIIRRVDNTIVYNNWVTLDFVFC